MKLSRRKRIYIFIIVLAALAVSVFFFLRSGKHLLISPLRAVPEDAAFVLEINDIRHFTNTVIESDPISIWQNYPEIKELLENFSDLVSFSENGSAAAEYLNEATLSISVHRYDQLNKYLFITGLNRSVDFKKAVKIVSEVSESAGYSRIAERKGQHRMELISETDTIHVGHCNNVLVFSLDEQLVRTSVMQMTSEKSGLWEHFKTHRRSKDEVLTLFTRNSSLKTFMNDFFYENSLIPTCFLPDSGSISLISDDQRLTLKTSGKFQEIPAKLSDQGELHLWKNAVQNTALGIAGHVKDLKFSAELSKILDDVYYEMVLQPLPLDIHPNTVMLIHVRDTSSFERKISNISSKLPERIMHNYDFQDHTAGQLQIGKVVSHRFQFLVGQMEYTYFILAGNTLILSSSPEILEKVLDDFEFHKNSNEFSHSVDAQTYSLFLNVPAFYPYLILSLKPSYRNLAENLYPVLSAYCIIRYFVHEQGSSERKIAIEFNPQGANANFIETADRSIIRIQQRNFRIAAEIMDFPGKMYIGQEDRVNTFYYPDSIVQAQGAYRDGLATGTWRFYYDTGTYQASVEFSEGRANGRAVYYRPRPDGKMLHSCSYQNNNLSGQYIEFHRNGKPALSVMYSNGQMSGKVRIYYPNGILMAEAEMKENERISDYRLFTVLGDFIDPADFNTTSLILRNHLSFIEFRRHFMEEETP